MLDSGRMGLIELDQDLNVDKCLGMLVSSLSIGRHIGDEIPLLIGMDNILDEIVSGRKPSVTLPRVMLQEGALAAKVLSVEILPSEISNRLRILIRDETELAELEQSILQQRNELTLANEALSEAKLQLEAALKEKATFLANISHDLKTPLQVIMGNAELLRGDLSKEEREGFLQDVLDNSNFLLALINDLLDASALEAGQLKFVEEPVDIMGVLEQTLSTARQMPYGQRRKFELNQNDGNPLILADPMRLRRLLLNLVSNAVKFTDDGGCIAVKAGAVDTGDFIIEIDDDGCGIEPELMQHAFEPFTKGGVNEGTGLGLYIAKGLAELHDAHLVLFSEPGAGTKARLSLPKSRVLKAST